MPIFAIAYLRDALLAKGEAGARPDELGRRMNNAMLPEAGSIHVEELSESVTAVLLEFQYPLRRRLP